MYHGGAAVLSVVCHGHVAFAEKGKLVFFHARGLQNNGGEKEKRRKKGGKEEVKRRGTERKDFIYKLHNKSLPIYSLL